VKPWIRLNAVETTRNHAQRVAAEWVLTQLSAEARMRREQVLEESAPPPVPTLTPAIVTRRDVRQVNFRLSHAEYGELQRVAVAYGVSGPRLARMLTMRGVRRVLTGD
jgi:hypothetical protein